MKMTREWAMPNPYTFEIPPIASLLDRWVPDCAVVVDPFAGRSNRATYSNDLRAEGGRLATDWLASLVSQGVMADVVLLAPPYSPRQVKECYDGAGIRIATQDTQSRFWREAKDGLDALLKPGGIAITCGWNSSGFGLTRGYELVELLLVCHGGAHNDTIVTVERKLQSAFPLLEGASDGLVARP